MNKIKVSIIVPVYNVEKYIERCINSIINQTLQDIEIIVVNDGSPDNSDVIIRKYMQLDSRIKLINQENQGLSIARNNGIKIAQGEYVAFVDSDDFIELDMYEKMYLLAKKNNSDIVCSNYKNIFYDCEVINKNLKDELIEIDKLGISEFFKLYYEELVTPVWNKIYRNKIIKDNNIKFVSNSIISSEDILFNLEYFCKIKKCFVSHEVLYNYIRREDSITTSNKPRPDMMNRCIKIAELFDEYCKRNEIDVNHLVLYIFYEELAIALSYINNLNLKSIEENLKIASKSYLFNRYIEVILNNNIIYSYGKYKDGCPKGKVIFDKVFAIFMKFNLVKLGAVMQLYRFKRVRKLNDSIKLAK